MVDVDPNMLRELADEVATTRDTIRVLADEVERTQKRLKLMREEERQLTGGAGKKKRLVTSFNFFSITNLYYGTSGTIEKICKGQNPQNIVLDGDWFQ